MPTEYIYNVKQPDGTYYSGPKATLPQAPVTRYSESITPPTAAPGAGAAPVMGTPSRYTNELENMFKTGGAYGQRTGPTPEEEGRIREQERQRVQAQIDAINELAEKELADARIRGENRAGRGRAISAATGTIGSPIGDTRATEIEDFNAKERAAIEAEKAARVGAILAGVQQRSDSIIEKYKTDARANADKFVDYLASVAQQSRGDMQALAAAGVDLDANQRERLIEQTGYDSQTFDALYKSMRISNAPEEEYINKNDPQIVGNKAIFFKQTKDPVTGKVTLATDEVELPESAQQKEIKQIVPRDDGMYVFYEDGTWDKVGQAKGPTATETKAADAATATAKAAQDRAKDVQTLIKEIKSAGNINQITGAWEWRGGLTGANQDLIAKVNRLKSLLTIDSIKNFKGLGAMSDREFSTASAAATSIAMNDKGTQVKLSESGFRSELDRIQAAMDTILSNSSQLGTGGGAEGGSSVQDRADAGGFDYEAMKASGYSDEDIEAALQAAGL